MRTIPRRPRCGPAARARAGGGSGRCHARTGRPRALCAFMNPVMSKEALPAVRESLRVAAVPWVAARVLVAAGWVIAANLVGSRFVEGRPEQLRQGLFMWDGSWYRDLAIYGYHSAPREAFRFFPLLPWLGRVIGALPLVPPSWVVVAIANAGALVAGVLIHRLTWLETGDARTAQRAVWMLAL